MERLNNVDRTMASDRAKQVMAAPYGSSRHYPNNCYSVLAGQINRQKYRREQATSRLVEPVSQRGEEPCGYSSYA